MRDEPWNLAIKKRRQKKIDRRVYFCSAHYSYLMVHVSELSDPFLSDSPERGKPSVLRAMRPMEKRGEGRPMISKRDIWDHWEPSAFGR